MSFVGPRPELSRYVQMFPDDFREILKVRPGITDLASVAYRQESSLLDDEEDAESRYVRTILPHKIRLAKLSVGRSSFWHDLGLMLETLVVLAYPARAIGRLLDRLGRRHVAVTMVLQLSLIAGANLAAMQLRFDGAPPADVRGLVVGVLPLLLLIRGVWLRAFNLHRDMWQYVGLQDLGAIVVSVSLGTATFWLLLRWPLGLAGYPHSIILLDAVLCVLALSGARTLRRVHRELRNRVVTTRRVLVVGASDFAGRILRDFAGRPGFDFRILGMVGEDPRAKGLRIHNVPIVGCCDELPEIVGVHEPDDILVIASAFPVARRAALIRTCRTLGVPVKVIPGLDEVLSGNVRSPCVEVPGADDFLFREPVKVDLERVGERFRGRRSLVTGAGGSIGSEICEQIAACSPSRLVLFEKHEQGLFDLERRLRRSHPDVPLDAVIGDVRDASRVEDVFASTRPEVVFHTAAYKHVSMMENNPWEAFKTNVLGTRIVAESSDRSGVGTFVLISTDKAVEPVCCVMGASKRMAELLVRDIASRSLTRFLTVRFGNVLESSGSVIPLFREQIERGVAVTVTHPDVTRWFMTVSEAVQLILEAVTIGQGGEVFVLDMGKPVRIVDLARSLIRQYGLRPDTDVPIVFTGLRPGERLFEKLFNDSEVVFKTRHPRILMAAEMSGAVAGGGNGNETGGGNGNEAGRGQRDAARAGELRRLAGLIRNAADRIGARLPAELAEKLEQVCNCSPEERRREGRTRSARDVGSA
jgi:FlaA1/EpsC-like NDP-sugar epimerase